MSDTTADVRTAMVTALNLGNLGDLRGTEHPEKGSMWSIRDFINVMNEKPIHHKYGMITWNRMLDGEYGAELATICCQLIIPGSQGVATPCADILGLQRIASILPGKIAGKYRDEVQQVFNLVIAGDKSMIKVIEHNATTNTPIQKLVRESLKRKGAEAGVVIEEDPEDKKLRRANLMLEMEERRANISRMHEETKRISEETAQLRKENLTSIEQHYTRLCVGGIIDDRARLLFKDGLLNTAGVNTSPQLAITNGEASIDTRPLTISTFATELKIRMSNAQGQQAGRIMARLYREKYGTEPTSHEQFVDGSVRPVKSYTRGDVSLMEQAIREATGRVIV
jgi:hypothetical protein